MDKPAASSPIRLFCSIVIVLGAVASLYFMFRVGRYNKSFLLMACFTIWVSSSFVGMWALNRICQRWTAAARGILTWLILFLIALALVCYGGIWQLPGARPAFFFLIIPLVTWLFLAMTIFLSRILLLRASDQPQ